MTTLRRSVVELWSLTGVRSVAGPLAFANRSFHLDCESVNTAWKLATVAAEVRRVFCLRLLFKARLMLSTTSWRVRRSFPSMMPRGPAASKWLPAEKQIMGSIESSADTTT